MSQHKNNQVINSRSNGNGNWMARDEERYEPEPEYQLCDECHRETHVSKIFDGVCKNCVQKALNY